MKHLHVLVMAGGSGTRFWPQSRRGTPKQFLKLTGECSLIEETVRRVEPLCPRENVWILTREDLEARVRDALPWISPHRVICEPEGRDTAPCLVLGGVRVERVDPDAVLLVLPADHVIPDRQVFCATIQAAVKALDEHDGLITFGIRPTYPATGYGYIRRADDDGVPVGSTLCYGVASFREKPDKVTAREYLEEGGFYWNAGIFLWRLSTFRSSLKEYAPELMTGWGRLQEIGDGLETTSDRRVRERFKELPRISIDYALMERAQNVRVVEAQFSWDDVGSWRAVERYRGTDDAGNITEGRTVLVDTQGSTVLATGGRVVATLGVENLLVVDTAEALLICPRERAEEIKKLVDGVREHGWEEAL